MPIFSTNINSTINSQSNSNAKNIAEVAVAELALLNSQNNRNQQQLILDSSSNLDRALKAEEELEKVKKERDRYKQLLCKPLVEIAEKDGNFKKTYEAQMQLMADWMVSQKAFKELAIEFGFEDGLSAEEVIQMGMEKKMDVLESKHDASHNTNANNSSVIRPHIDALKEKLKAERKK